MSPLSSRTENSQSGAGQIEYVDPDPLSVILEIANLVFQPGSLALIANLAGGGGAVASAVIAYKELTGRKRSDIRRQLYVIDRALTKGFSGLMTLASLLEEFNFIDARMAVGGAPIKGFKNTQLLRRTHEDCRAAVKDARDAFIDLSGLLPREHAQEIRRTIDELNEIAVPMLGFREPYGVILVTASLAFTKVDELICRIGEKYEFNREPRKYFEELRSFLPSIREYYRQLPSRYQS
jgi:hypothetical protein